MDSMDKVLGKPTEIVIDGTGYLFSPITFGGWLDCQNKIRECERARAKERIRELKDALEIVPMEDSEKRILLQGILSGEDDANADELPNEVVVFMIHKSLLKEHPGLKIEEAEKLLDQMDISEALKVLGLADTSDIDSAINEVGSKPSSGESGS